MCLHRPGVIQVFYRNLGQIYLLKIKYLIEEQVVFNCNLVSSFLSMDQVAYDVHEHNFGGYVHAFVTCDGGGTTTRDLAKNSDYESFFIVCRWPLVLDVIKEALCRDIQNQPELSVSELIGQAIN